MIPLFLLVLGVASPQEGDVDRIMLRLTQRREKVQSQAEFVGLLAETRSALEGYLKDHAQAADAGRALFHIAETYLWSADYPTALAKLRSVVESYPEAEDAPTAAFLIGQVLLREDDLSMARKALGDFVIRYPKDDRVLMARTLIAVTWQNEQKYDEAERLLLSIREDFKGRKESWSALLQLAVVYHLQSKNDDAQRVLSQVVSECPDRSLTAIARKEIDLYSKVGTPAKAFAATDLSGNAFTLQKARGKVLILYFFDSAAPAAAQEIQFLKRVQKTLLGQPLVICGVSLNQDRGDVMSFRDLQGITWPLLFDGRGLDGTLARLYDVRGLPSLTVIDKSGTMRFFNVAGRDLENAAKRLLIEE